MNLREEIIKLDRVDYTDPKWRDNPKYDLIEVSEQELLELFKKWALEMVGENDPINWRVEDVFDDAAVQGAKTLLTRSYCKEAIRQRIEESTK